MPTGVRAGTIFGSFAAKEVVFSCINKCPRLIPLCQTQPVSNSLFMIFEPELPKYGMKGLIWLTGIRTAPLGNDRFSPDDSEALVSRSDVGGELVRCMALHPEPSTPASAVQNVKPSRPTVAS